MAVLLFLFSLVALNLCVTKIFEILRDIKKELQKEFRPKKRRSKFCFYDYVDATERVTK